MKMSLEKVSLLFIFVQTSKLCQGTQVAPQLVCEHSTLSLRCRGNTHLNILSASYGREVGTSVCHGKSYAVTRKCHASSSLSKVQEACQGKQSCSILASNSIFGDPCVGIYKYLEVKYECVEDPTRLVCEHSTLSLECFRNTQLNIISASYGRNAGRAVCPSPSIHVTSGCHASSSLSKVREDCQGEESCSILASNSVFGDPCVGTYKYLEVKYECVDSPKRRVCEHSTLSLQCVGNTKLNIISANYGRNAGGDVCPHPSIQVTSGCYAASSLSKVREACQAEKSCSILASNSVFGDPCVGTYKYLEVEYKCVEVKTARACEHSTLSLKCRGHSHVNIISANYGRNAGRGFCPHPSILVTSGCRASSSLRKVRETCQGRHRCSILASNSVFGDPCVGTYKYLEVKYLCY